MTEPTEAESQVPDYEAEAIEALPEIVPDVVHVYVCPECGTWYGSSLAPDLAKMPNIRTSMRNTADRPEEVGSISGYRIECQACKGRGQTVSRLRLAYVRVSEVKRILDEQIERLYLEEERRAGAKLIRHTQHSDPS